eukprot:scaffold7341_cov129-Isochrysis_galbana.AAC.5
MNDRARLVVEVFQRLRGALMVCGVEPAPASLVCQKREVCAVARFPTQSGAHLSADLRHLPIRVVWCARLWLALPVSVDRKSLVTNWLAGIAGAIGMGLEAHHVARRGVARSFLRRHVCRGRVGRPGGRGSGARPQLAHTSLPTAHPHTQESYITHQPPPAYAKYKANTHAGNTAATKRPCHARRRRCGDAAAKRPHSMCQYLQSWLSTPPETGKACQANFCDCKGESGLSTEICLGHAQFPTIVGVRAAFSLAASAMELHHEPHINAVCPRCAQAGAELLVLAIDAPKLAYAIARPFQMRIRERHHLICNQDGHALILRERFEERRVAGQDALPLNKLRALKVGTHRSGD